MTTPVFFSFHQPFLNVRPKDLPRPERADHNDVEASPQGGPA